MSLYEWLLFGHLLAAFALVAGVGAYGVIVFSGSGAAQRALTPPAIALWNAGGLGVLVFGIALALDVDGYEVWDGWILLAIVLWVVASAAGGRLSRGLREGTTPSGSGGARVMVAVMVLATALLLLDMIVKPGA